MGRRDEAGAAGPGTQGVGPTRGGGGAGRTVRPAVHLCSGGHRSADGPAVVGLAGQHEGRGDGPHLGYLAGGPSLGPQGQGHAGRGRAPGGAAALRPRVESGRALLPGAAPGHRGTRLSGPAGQAGGPGAGPERLAGGSGAGQATVRLGLDPQGPEGSAHRYASNSIMMNWYENEKSLRMNRTDTIYADYQATTPVDPRVLERMMPYWKESFGNPHSSDHVVGWQAAEAVRDSLTSVAGLIGADPDEIVFTSGATEANNLALLGSARRAPESRRRILVSTIEHKCVLEATRTLKAREGFAVDTIPVDREGFINLDALESMVDESVFAVSVMAVNNEVGTIQHLPAIAELLACHEVLFHCDAAQAPSAMNVSRLVEYADLISLSAHKMYGPQGIGALYIRRDTQNGVEPIIYGGGQQNGLRSGTLPVPLCVGMAVAAEIIRAEGADERLRVECQRDLFVGLLQDCGFPVAINGPQSEWRHPGNANLQFGRFAAQDILGSVQPRLAASTGAACASGIPEPSHVLRALGLSEREADSSVRFSFGRFTTYRDVREAATLVVDALESLVETGADSVMKTEEWVYGR